MAGGWARDGAVQDQIDASVEDAVAEARSRLKAQSSVKSATTLFRKLGEKPFPACGYV